MLKADVISQVANAFVPAEEGDARNHASARATMLQRSLEESLSQLPEEIDVRQMVGEIQGDVSAYFESLLEGPLSPSATTVAEADQTACLKVLETLAA